MMPDVSGASRHAIPLLLAVVTALATGAGLGCDSDDADDEAPADSPDTPPTFRSSEAPYAVELPGGWKLEPEGELNEHADLRASKGNRFFAVVIPQKLPAVEGVESPGVKDLKRATLQRMRRNDDSFDVERTGPVTLDGAAALSVFAEGESDGDAVQYVLTFITRDSWGYQLVAWGPPDAQKALVESVDRIIRGWQFTGETLIAPDVGTTDTSSMEQSDR